MATLKGEMMNKEQVVVGCDWKNPHELVVGLVKNLPSLGIYAYEDDNGSDCYNVLISKTQLSPEEVKKAWKEYHENC